MSDLVIRKELDGRFSIGGAIPSSPEYQKWLADAYAELTERMVERHRKIYEELAAPHAGRTPARA